MERGFVLANPYGGLSQAWWIEGVPIRSAWTGLRIKGRPRVPVVTFRCTHCGYLKSYAREDAGPVAKP